MTLAKTDCLNLLFSSDDAYAQHMCAAIYSVLEHNVDFQKIQIYIVDNEISAENVDKLEQMVSLFHNAKIFWINYSKWKSQLSTMVTFSQNFPAGVAIL
jgi:lipopolysaccharide biosynthesis glycosyltransferase